MWSENLEFWPKNAVWGRSNRAKVQVQVVRPWRGCYRSPGSENGENRNFSLEREISASQVGPQRVL